MSLESHMFIVPMLPGTATASAHHARTACRKKDTPRFSKACVSPKSPPEIRVCIGSSCKTDGSSNTIDVVRALSSSAIKVCATGCLGECGCGPNAIAVSQSIVVPTIAKRLRSAQAVKNFLNSVGCQVEPTSFDAVNLKEVADTQLQAGKAAAAASLYPEAAKALQQFPSLYISTLCNWSAALVECGRPQDALEIANSAVDADTSRLSAWRRKAQAHEACNQVDFAISAWTVAGRLSGNLNEAQRNVRRLKKKRFFRFWKYAFQSFAEDSSRPSQESV